jgi:small subunit ribosomal protein S7
MTEGRAVQNTVPKGQKASESPIIFRRIFMPRKRIISKREVMPDTKYKSVLVAKFVNNLMKKGKKSIARKILYNSFDIIKDKTKQDPLVVFQRAVENVRPSVEVKSRRVGGSTYQVPTEVRPLRRQALSIRWLINFASLRGEKTMAAKLAGELIDASNSRGAAIKKKEDTHRMAEANKAFAHYRW